VSITTIPAKTLKTCDRCGVTMDGKNSSQEGALHIKAHALDWQGMPCADASRKLDLCNRCLYDVCAAIDAAIKSDVPVQPLGGA
jgi:hypothetical protein